MIFFYFYIFKDYGIVNVCEYRDQQAGEGIEFHKNINFEPITPKFDKFAYVLSSKS